MSTSEWYYCLKHHTVEPVEACRAVDRLGPYPTRAEAEQALQKSAQRNEDWIKAEEQGMTPDEIEEYEDREKHGSPFR